MLGPRQELCKQETLLLLPSLTGIEHVVVSMVGPDVPANWDGLRVLATLHAPQGMLYGAEDSPNNVVQRPDKVSYEI